MTDVSGEIRRVSGQGITCVKSCCRVELAIQVLEVDSRVGFHSVSESADINFIDKKPDGGQKTGKRKMNTEN